jgi:hypothetical protein
MMKILLESDRYKIDKRGIIYNVKSGKPLSCNNYVNLDGRGHRTKFVVANNLLQNPFNYSNIVNIDKNRDNNLVENLMWAEAIYGKTIFDKKKDALLRMKISVYIVKCNNKNASEYKKYGAKGVKVWQGWVEDTMEFVKWSKENNYEKGMWLYRYDKRKGHSPDNCYWGEPQMGGKLNCEMVDNIKKLDSKNKEIAEKYQITSERVRQLKTGGKLKRCQ